jgi:hypothetical protein
MSYVVANVVLVGIPVLGMALVRRRLRKDIADMAWSEQFSADLRDAL